MDTTVFNWIIMPLLIFVARVIDVSMDTVRIILISKGRKHLVPFIGFLQVLIWLFAFRQVILNLSNIMCYIGFAGGFAVGSYVGMIIEERLAIGYEVLRVITKKDARELIEALKKKNFGVTIVDARGSTGNVNVIFTIAQRKDIPTALALIKQFNPNAFYSIEEIRSVQAGVFPATVDAHRRSSH
jgi:uncharacterized protein YebE (UPF0316 family)